MSNEVKNPYEGDKLLGREWAKGRKARLVGAPRDRCPVKDYPSKGGPRAWREGWDSVAAEVEPVTPPAPPETAPPVVTRPVAVTVQEPAVRVPGQGVPGQGRARPAPDGEKWPAEEPLPTEYRKPKPAPCPKCRALRLPNTSQATVVANMKDRIAYLRCRACGHRFKLAVAS